LCKCKRRIRKIHPTQFWNESFRPWRGPGALAMHITSGTEGHWFESLKGTRFLSENIVFVLFHRNEGICPKIFKKVSFKYSDTLMHSLWGYWFLHTKQLGLSVTRLVEFSPIGRLFSLCSFPEITKVAHIFVLFFPTVKIIIFAKNGLGHILGEFLTNSSGLPVWVVDKRLSHLCACFVGECWKKDFLL
jgi:hypothetical protein